MIAASITHDEIILSPERQMAAMAINCAACPLDVATAATPPSSAAMRRSKTPYMRSHKSADGLKKIWANGLRTTVGLPMRE